MIHFYKRDKNYRYPNQKKLRVWLHELAALHNHIIEELSYEMVSKKDIKRINNSFLAHDYITDIITFQYNNDKSVMAEIFICPDKIKEQASIYESTETNELLRVMAHGLLHCIGFNDKTIKQEKTMRTAEDNALSLWKSIK